MLCTIDDPTPGTTNARNARSGARIFPSISSRFPMMEGYAFITLDSTIGELGDNNSVNFGFYMFILLLIEQCIS